MLGKSKVLARVPKPKDGQDGHSIDVPEVVAIVLAKIPKPKDGRYSQYYPEKRRNNLCG